MLKDIKKKLDRMDPVKKVRKLELDQETMKLNLLRNKKSEMLELLKSKQNQYSEGVRDLNVNRVSKNRENLLTLERGLDLVKEQWISTLKELKRIEFEEKLQLEKVVAKEIEFKSIEKLQEKTQISLNEAILKYEQKQMDELSSQRHYRGRK